MAVVPCSTLTAQSSARACRGEFFETTDHKRNLAVHKHCRKRIPDNIELRTVYLWTMRLQDVDIYT